MEPTPLQDIAAGDNGVVKMVDLGGTAGAPDYLQQYIAADAGVNSVELGSREPAVSAPKPESPNNDFSNLVGGPKAPGLG